MSCMSDDYWGHIMILDSKNIQSGQNTNLYMLCSCLYSSSSAENVNWWYFKDMIVIENEMINEVYVLLKYQAMMSILHEKYPDSTSKCQEKGQDFCQSHL